MTTTYALGDFPIDPQMRAWIDAFLEAGWTLEVVGANFVQLGWPSEAARFFPQAQNSLMVPTQVEHEHFEATFDRMSRALGTVCELVGKIRAVEHRVYQQHVAHGWPRQRPIRWPSHDKEKR